MAAGVSQVSLLTPLGHLTVFAEDGAVVALDFGRGAPTDDPPDPAAIRARDQLNAYFNGTLRDFDLPLRPAGSPFEQTVWQAMRRIPHGETRTYGDLAAAIGGVARAVGGACGANPIPIIIPCHRVLGAGGRLVGYSGGEGPETKQALLRLEGALLI